MPEFDPLSRPKILLVDDEKPQLDILHRWLTHSGYQPYSATSGVEAIALAQQEQFEVIVTDLRMPGLNGLQLLSVLKELTPEAEVIFLSGQGTMQDAIEALREGKAFDFLQKPLRDLQKLNAVIEKARERRQQKLGVQTAVPAFPQQESEPLPQHIEPLTSQELQLVALLAQGLDNRSIAEQLHFSEKTIRNYLTRIYDKLGVNSRLQAVALCQQYGLVGAPRIRATSPLPPIDVH